jgi:hypothetical protein
MSLKDDPVGIKPWKVALFSFRVPPLTTKSSPDSISILPALDGRDAVAILPSTSPVLKKNGTALAGPLQDRTTATITMENARRLIATSTQARINCGTPCTGI